MDEEFAVDNRKEVHGIDEFVPESPSQSQSRGCAWEREWEGDRSVKGLFRAYYETFNALIRTPRDLFSHFGNDRSYKTLLLGVLLIFHLLLLLVVLLFFVPIGFSNGIASALFSFGNIIIAMMYSVFSLAFMWLFVVATDLLQRFVGSARKNNHNTLVRIYLLVSMFYIPCTFMFAFLMNVVRLVGRGFFDGPPPKLHPLRPEDATSLDSPYSLPVMIKPLIVCVIGVGILINLYCSILFTYGASRVQRHNVIKMFAILGISSTISSIVGGITLIAIAIVIVVISMSILRYT